MRNSSTIGIAVAGILAASAAGTASANSYTLYVTGASAQRTFWESDLGFLCNGVRATPATKWTVIPSPDPGGTGIAVSYPDIEAVQCLVTTSAQIPGATVVTAGDTITMQYAAELGSVWGIAPFLTSTNAFTSGRHFLDITNPNVCPPAGGACTVTGYSRQTDLSSTGLAAAVTPDLGATDAEPSLWVGGDDWPLTAGVGNSYPILANASTNKQPTPQEILAFAALPAQTRVNQQVLSVIVNTAAPTGSLTSLSKASITSILTGKFTNWGGVPEIGNSAITVPIVVCRRDHGSGTEVTASVTFTGAQCGPGAQPIVRQRNGNVTPSLGKLASANVIENATTNELVACVTSKVGAIGIRSLSFSSSYVTLAIDGVEANAHNAANARYPYAYDAWVYTGSPTLTGAKLDVANALITDAQTASALAHEGGTFTASLFLWTVSGNSNGAKAAAAGQYEPGGSAAPSLGADWGNPSGAPEALYNQGGNSCAPKYDQFTLP